MTRIPTATRRQQVAVRASRTGPKLPSLHARPRQACRGSLRVRQLKKHNRFGYRRPELNLQPCTDSQKGFLPARNDRVSTLVTHGGCAATPKDRYFRRQERTDDVWLHLEPYLPHNTRKLMVLVASGALMMLTSAFTRT